MTAIICVDSGGGTSFFGRRQSTDGAVRKRILEIADGKPLVMDGYSAFQFRGCGRDITVTDDAARCGGAVCFFELGELPEADKIERLVIFRWNRSYPRDSRLTLDPFEAGMRLGSIRDFPGTSHDRITEEIWIRDAEEIK